MEPQKEPKTTGHAAMDVVAAPPPDAEEKASKAESVKHDSAPAKKAPKPKATGQPRDGSVVAAIFATVIIVLGLAALTVFAYLKQTGKI